MSGDSHGPLPSSSEAATPPRALLFDLDGTLVATRRLYLESFADALEPVLGHRPGHDEMMALRPRAEIRFLRELGGSMVHHEVMDRFYRAYESRHDHDFQGVYSGVREMLARLRNAALPLGLVTGKSRRSWTITRPRVELGSFPVEVFDDDVPEAKPHPAGLLLALSRLATLEGGLGSVHPGEVAYVGDSPTDLEAAARAGLRPWAVLWSKRAHERRPFASQARSLGGIALVTPGELVREVLRAGPTSVGSPRRLASGG